MSKKTPTKSPTKSKPAPKPKTAPDGTPLNRKGEPKRTSLDSARERALKRLAAHKATQDARADAVVDDGEFDAPSANTTSPNDAAAAKGGPKARTAAKGSPTAERGANGGKTAKAKPAKPAKPKRLSALDAAAKVLAESDRPLRAIDMIEVMHAKGLWTSPGGKTPEASLYAAVIREIAAKGKDARFKKVDRGMFASTPAAPTTAKSGKGG